MDIDKIKRKIGKLLRLAKSDNPNESALALLKAKRLMDDYHISEQDVVDQEIREAAAKVKGTLSTPLYTINLASMIADLFRCKIYKKSTREMIMVDGLYDVKIRSKIVFVGMNVDAELAKYTFDILNRKLMKSRTQYIKNSRIRIKRNKTARADAYALGWVQGVAANIKHLVPAKTEQVKSYELMIINQLDLYLKQKNLEPQEVKAGKINDQDFSKGYVDGSKEQVHKAMNNDNLSKLN
ncbi:MAG: DUF2786 domain-containing protein [Bacteroidota bacterium]